jgi:hypothetical protein
VSFAPGVGIAAVLRRHLAAVAIERVRLGNGIDGAQEIGKPAKIFGGPDDGGFHFADREPN